MSDNLLVFKAKSGDSVALTDLIKKYSGLVYSKSRSFSQSGVIDSDDLYQEGMIGLLSAVYSFDDTRDTKFSTYASTVVERKMLSVLRSINSKKNLPQSLSVPFEDEKDLLALTPTPEESLIINEEIDTVNEFVKNNLSKTEQKVFKLNLRGMSYREIAEILECDEKSVDNALQRIRKKIKNIK